VAVPDRRHDRVEVKRGDVVTIALAGDYGKPRPAVVIQSDFFAEHPSVTILPVTSELRDAPLFRIGVEPDAASGLRKRSQVMVDKAQTVARGRLGGVIGRLSLETMVAVDRGLLVFLGIG
jgi:mRNA interferase MazF